MPGATKFLGRQDDGGPGWRQRADWLLVEIDIDEGVVADEPLRGRHVQR